MDLIEAGESYRRVHDLLRERVVRPMPARPSGDNSASAAPFAAPAAGWPSDGRNGDIGCILRARRSVREFSRAPVELGQLVRIVGAARRLCDDTWPASRHGALPVTVIAAVNGVPGDKPGLLQVRAGGCEPICGLDARLADTLGREYANAPAILLLCCDPHRLGHDSGGYGSVLVRAGSAGYAIWLAAIAEGLQASVYGRTSNDITRVARQVSPRLRHLFTVAVGREYQETSDATNRT